MLPAIIRIVTAAILGQLRRLKQNLSPEIY